jgi:hypothetical protein
MKGGTIQGGRHSGGAGPLRRREIQDIRTAALEIAVSNDLRVANFRCESAVNHKP